MPRTPHTTPTASSKLAKYDAQCRRRTGAGVLGGIDEAGRGCLAGPVVAGCVCLPPGAGLPGLNDSKQLSATAREELVPKILETALGWGLGWAMPREIDEVNILQATLRAAGRAIEAMKRRGTMPDHLLTDYLKLPAPPCPFEAIKKGDATSQCIAAASVLAKVARDRILVALDSEYPQYGLAAHKGYGSKRHLEALREHGPSHMHRLTFRGVCFFHTTAQVRAVSADQLEGDRPGEPDWERVLGAEAELKGAHYLPHAEWHKTR